MHDLRTAVFRHLQRLSLAFFTRTRTGEVQSRIPNDIGGVQNVVTNTATSIASNVTTVVATMVGMLLLNWQLALFAFALIPLFALLTRRVGNERRRIAKNDAGVARRHLEPRAGIALGLGDPARQDDGPWRRARRPVRGRVAATSPTSRCVSGWPAAGSWPRSRRASRSCRRPSTGSAVSSWRAARTRCRFRCWSRSRPSRPGSSSRLDRCSGSAWTCRPRSRSSTGSSSTSTSPSTSTRSRMRFSRAEPVMSSTTTSGSATGTSGRCGTSRSRFPPARRPRSSERPAPARRRSATSPRACTTSAAGD